LAEDVEAATSLYVEEMAQELTQPEGVETSAAEMLPEKATTEVGETSTLQEEEATTEVRGTPTLQDLPKDSTSPDLQLGKEVLMPRMFLSSPFWLMLR